MSAYEVILPNDEEDSDNRTPLPPGTKIVDKLGTIYTIKAGETTSGGSSLLYKVSREGSERNFVIKECYPRSRKYEFVRINGVVRPKSDDVEAKEFLMQIKKNMAYENKIGQFIANKTGRTIAAWEDLIADKIIFDGKTVDATDCGFIVMEQATEKNERGWFLEDLLRECAEPVQDNLPLRNDGLPSPIVVVCVMEELLKALRDVHRAGFIHGDIQDANFFLMGCDLESGDIGVGQLFDFGNVRKLLPDGKTATISDKNIFSTKGYYSPEILTKNDGSLRLSPATDIYSAGCLMLYLFKGMDYKETCGGEIAKTFSLTEPIDVEELTERGYRLEAALLFTRILSKALERKPENRYKDAGEMLKDIIFLKKILAPPKFTLSRNLSRSPYFVPGSRDSELDRLQDELDSGTHPLWIWGIGGVGKTELAMEFARNQIERGRAAYLVTFRGSMKETVLQMNFSGWRFEFDGQGDASTQEYKARLDLLKENYKDVLLIIDNFEHEDKTLAELQREPAYRDIIGLDIKILFTTRSRPNDSAPELEAFDEENAFELFKSIVKKISPAEEKDVRKLIREVECHPMTVEILAKTLNESWGTLSAKELLVKLKTESLNSDSLPEVKHKKFLNEHEAKIYGHLRTLFKLFNVDESYREILCHTTILPFDGMNAAEFILSEEDSKKKLLKKIEGNGWIRRREESNLLYIHPLIRSVLKNELKPTNADCERFLSTLWQRLDDLYPPDKNLFRQTAELYERAVNDLGDEKGEHNFHAGYSYLISENYAQAILHEEEAVRLREAALEASDLALARTYNDAGVTAFFLKDYDKGMSFLSKAIKVLEENSPDDPNAANIYSNMGDAYLMLGDYEKAVSLTEKAVKIFSKTPPKNKHEHANAHRVFGMSLIWVKRYVNAMEEFFAAEKIFHELAPEGSIDLALIYSNIGELYAIEKDTDKALDYLFKSLELQEKFLPKNHNDIIFSYHLLGEAYRLAGKEEESKKFFDKEQAAIQETQENSLKDLLKVTLDIIEMSSDKMTDEEFIKRHRNVADCYRKLGDLQNAQKYISLAEGKISPVTAPTEAALTYFTMADIYSDKKDLDAALKYAKKSTEVDETFSPENFGALSTDYMHLGNLSYTARKFEDALDYFRCAIEFQLKCSHPDFDNVKLLQKFIGTILVDLKRYDEAAKVFEKLLNEWSMILHESHPVLQEIQTRLEFVRKQRDEK